MTCTVLFLTVKVTGAKLFVLVIFSYQLKSIRERLHAELGEEHQILSLFFFLILYDIFLHALISGVG